MVLISKMVNRCIKDKQTPCDDEMFWMWTEVAFELFLLDLLFLGNIVGTPLLRLTF